ncbi:hypothetical protein [Formosa agariphila]|uniref:hypothetical protein n=1 Tax=Formosa agariphila TaxID=320324 RepID=UPI0011DE2043|nr:hypothetical protein [Formosa agariphila]
MKNTLLYFVLILILFTSCSQKSYTALYREDTRLEQNEIKYNLPKNLLKLEIVYTLNEPRVFKNGKDQALTSSTTKITIEDPLKISKLFVADRSKTFVLKGAQVAEDYFLNPDEYADTANTETVSDVCVQNISRTEAVLKSSFTDSSKEAQAYSSVIEILDNLSRIKTKVDADYTLDLVSMYKSKITTVNEDFKPYIRKSKVKYTVIIDPSASESPTGQWAVLSNGNIQHTIYPKHIFKENTELIDTVTIVTPNIENYKLSHLEDKDAVEGLVYRSPSSETFSVKLNNQLLDGDALQLSQFGTMKVITVDELISNVDSDILLFKSKDTPKATGQYETIASLNDTVELLDFDSNETIEASQIAIKNEYEEKLKKIDLLINKLKARKKEL